MSKVSLTKSVDDLRPEYDLSKLGGRVAGKYYRRAMAGTNLVLIEPELVTVFPDTESVNRALRLLVETVGEIVRPPRGSRARTPVKAVGRLEQQTVVRRRVKSSSRRKGVAGNRLVRDYLAGLAGHSDELEAARNDLKKLFRKSRYKLGERSWTRDQLHERG